LHLIRQRSLERRKPGLVAHEAGASYAVLGRVVGLTRQRIARIIQELYVG